MYFDCIILILVLLGGACLIIASITFNINLLLVGVALFMLSILVFKTFEFLENKKY